jgi:hypothetical protein
VPVWQVETAPFAHRAAWSSAETEAQNSKFKAQGKFEGQSSNQASAMRDARRFIGILSFELPLSFEL